jgi:hypothetical protein
MYIFYYLSKSFLHLTVYCLLSSISVTTQLKSKAYRITALEEQLESSTRDYAKEIARLRTKLFELEISAAMAMDGDGDDGGGGGMSSRRGGLRSGGSDVDEQHMRSMEQQLEELLRKQDPSLPAGGVSSRPGSSSGQPSGSARAAALSLKKGATSSGTSSTTQLQGIAAVAGEAEEKGDEIGAGGMDADAKMRNTVAQGMAVDNAASILVDAITHIQSPVTVPAPVPVTPAEGEEAKEGEATVSAVPAVTTAAEENKPADASPAPAEEAAPSPTPSPAPAPASTTAPASTPPPQPSAEVAVVGAEQDQHTATTAPTADIAAAAPSAAAPAVAAGTDTDTAHGPPRRVPKFHGHPGEEGAVPPTLPGSMGKGPEGPKDPHPIDKTVELALEIVDVDQVSPRADGALRSPTSNNQYVAAKVSMTLHYHYDHMRKLSTFQIQRLKLSHYAQDLFQNRFEPYLILSYGKDAWTSTTSSIKAEGAAAEWIFDSEHGFFDKIFKVTDADMANAELSQFSCVLHKKNDRGSEDFKCGAGAIKFTKELFNPEHL